MSGLPGPPGPPKLDWANRSALAHAKSIAWKWRLSRIRIWTDTLRAMSARGRESQSHGYATQEDIRDTACVLPLRRQRRILDTGWYLETHGSVSGEPH